MIDAVSSGVPVGAARISPIVSPKSEFSDSPKYSSETGSKTSTNDVGSSFGGGVGCGGWLGLHYDGTVL